MNHNELEHVQQSALDLSTTDANPSLNTEAGMQNEKEGVPQNLAGPPKTSSEADEAKREDASSNEGSKPVNAKPALVLRSRRRPRKARQKHVFHGEENKDDKQSTTISDLLLLNEVQEMRAKSRTSTKRIVKKQEEETPSDVDQKEDGEDLIALRSNFSLERSTNAVEERMHKYIDERMKEKFGERFRSNEVNTDAAQESDLYDVPEHLKPKERPLYDPGEGLPAAGVEEVEISPQARQKNVEETVKAHMQLLEKGKRRGSTSQGTAAVHDFAEKTTLRSEAGQGAGGTASPGNDSVAGSIKNPGQRRRFELATDGLAYERFKKRMRK